MKLDSEHLEILAMIIEKGGLTEGADALGKSQPSVSRTMALLEDRIGAPLFEPGKRPLRATELGESLARIGARIHTLNTEASKLVQSYRKGHTGRIRIAGTPIFMDGVVSTLIADFHNRHPDVQLAQSYGYFDSLAVGLRNGSLDMAILPLHPNAVPADMTFVPLLPGRNVVACRAVHPLAGRGAITLSDLEPYPWIAPPPESPLFRDLQRALKSIGKEDFRVNFSGGTFASIVSVLAGSDSLTVLPYSVVFLARRTVGLEALPLKIEHPDRRLGMLSVGARQAPPALRLFADFLVEEFKLLEARMQHEQQVTRRRG
ncbi:LysR family transcriptional regulator [Mesorhizobium loti]|uniref:LysR family transcriptional regulator n=1 Tax=Rhizobium loti TaxID=381 RepID=A0A101KV19_RHILI|nr:LysR family transcriptional regulator [Mesorhizobium loti]